MLKWDKVVLFLSAAPLARIGVSAIVTPVLGLFLSCCHPRCRHVAALALTQTPAAVGLLIG